MWLTDGFSVTFFWKVEGTVRIHVSHVQLPYMVINVHGNMQGRGERTEHWKTRKFRKSSNCNKGGREHWQPYWIFYMAAILKY